MPTVDAMLMKLRRGVFPSRSTGHCSDALAAHNGESQTETLFDGDRSTRIIDSAQRKVTVMGGSSGRCLQSGDRTAKRTGGFWV